MTEHETLHDPEPSWGGPDVQAAVLNAEEGSQVEGVHTAAEPGESGDSRLERLRDEDASADRLTGDEGGGEH